MVRPLVKIEASIDPSNKAHTDALNTFLSVLGGGAKKPKKATTTTATVEPVEEEAVEKVDTETAKKAKKQLEFLRALVVEKSKIDKAAVKAKMKKLGATSLSKLDPKYFKGFKAFLDGIEDPF